MAQQMLEIPGLVYYPDTKPGIRRHKRGRGFSYIDIDGTTIACKIERQRLASLGIPPAYSDVWICPRPNGHLLATGRDAAERKQYRYHPLWTEAQAEAKFAELQHLLDVLPRIRRWIAYRLAKDDASEDAAVACVLALLDRMSLRVGSKTYTEQNGSYAAITLLSDHLVKMDGRMALSYRAKGGKMVDKPILGERLIWHLQRLKSAPGGSLIKWQDARGRWKTLHAQKVHDRISDLTDDLLTPKVFRTWNGSHAAFVEARANGRPTIKSLSEAAAERLHNTPAIARKSYIHPKIIAWAQKARPFPEDRGKVALLREGEAGLMRLLAES